MFKLEIKVSLDFAKARYTMFTKQIHLSKSFLQLKSIFEIRLLDNIFELVCISNLDRNLC